MADQSADYVVEFRSEDGSESATYRTKSQERAEKFAERARRDGWIVTVKAAHIDRSEDA